MLTLVYAQDQAGGIGYQNQLPWHLPNDLKFFKQVTLGHAILMGRVTFDGLNRRLLPNRTSIILTNNQDYQIDDENALVFNTIEDVLDWYQHQDKNLYVIGGAQIIAAFEPYLDELIQTQIAAKLDGDTYFPQSFDWSLYQEVSSEFYPKDEKNIYDFTVKKYQRKDS